MNWYRGHEGKTLTGIGYKQGNAHWVLAENFPPSTKKFSPVRLETVFSRTGEKNLVDGGKF
jgi:hypothetical protein